MGLTLWEFLEKTNVGGRYTNSDLKYSLMEKKLKSLEKDKVRELEKEWFEEWRKLTRHKEYGKLHWSDGGYVTTSDDGFYMDHGSWVLAQGKGLVDDFYKRGAIAVVEYIERNSVDEDDYMYECLGYPFSNVR